MIEEETEQEISMKQVTFYLLCAVFLLGLFFDPEGGSTIFLQYIC
jgi:hypothetical protein